MMTSIVNRRPMEELVPEIDDQTTEPEVSTRKPSKTVKASNRYHCVHGRQKYSCKECKGTQVCKHTSRLARIVGVRRFVYMGGKRSFVRIVEARAFAPMGGKSTLARNAR